MIRTLMAGGALTLTLVACGDSGASDGASSSEVSAIAEQCSQQLNLGAEGCACVAEKSDELSAKERAFVLASLQGDDAEATSLRASMAPDEAMRAAMFLVNAPAACAREGN